MLFDIINGDKVTTIKSLSLDNNKEYYLKKYSLLLDTYIKIDIIYSFFDVDCIFEYVPLFKKEESYKYFINCVFFF